MRKSQRLPPFFAIIRGPTIQPYRMEERSVSLGRVTPHHRDVDINLSSKNSNISRLHCRIVYDHGLGCYCIVNLAKNGIKVKHGGVYTEHKEIGVPYPLRNPAIIDIQGVPIYFQVFYIAAKKPQKRPRASRAASETKKDGRKTKKKKKIIKQRKGQTTYSQMIQSALKELGGVATHTEIAAYIQKAFPTDISGRKTWRNSVSGVLSANSLFHQEPSPDPAGKFLWRLKNYSPSSPSSPTTQGALPSTNTKRKRASSDPNKTAKKKRKQIQEE
eukprot:CAMPEP_0174267768 /NCGR_PEP_ID=MMETSP0439-20130205/34880_1 /TAXON_ID=0 /ORGANISM="Stereomyxa ramosa, Strain Chinc5" /LENGTH=272 /DNA_ID=CAMNT_0015355473 /DNA_START=102 /DNA_END=920 /DNA_ORIENTATION=-